MIDSSVRSEGSELVLSATEDLLMNYMGSNGIHEPNDWYRQRQDHEFRFQLVDGAWQLVFDSPVWPKNEQGQRDGPDPLQDVSPPLIDGPSSRRVSALAWGTYNASGAASYAYDHAFSYNGSYVDFTGNDCTNLVSQALRHGGGWVDSAGAWFWNGAWWYDLDDHDVSNTWVNASQNRSHVFDSGRGYSLSAFVDLAVGDLMWADWNYASDPDIDHAMMVTSKTSNNYDDIQFSYHDTDRQNYPLSSILASNPTSSNLYYGARIQYTNP